MAKAVSGKSSGGGGVKSRQHVKPTVRGGPSVTKKISVEAAAGIGIKRGNKSMDGTAPLNKAAKPHPETSEAAFGCGIGSVAINAANGRSDTILQTRATRPGFVRRI